MGAWNLHQLTKHIELDFFINYSSAASILGAMAQSNYVLANAFLDALAQHRSNTMISGMALGFGPWSSGGMAARLGESGAKRAAAMGIESYSAEEALSTSMHLLSNPTAHRMLLRIDWRKFLHRQGRLTDSYFKVLAAGIERTTKSNRDEAFLARLSQATPKRKRILIAEQIQNHLGAVLSLHEPQNLDLDHGLFELGLDSMTVLELTERLENTLGLRLPGTLLFDHATIRSISEYIVQKFSPEGSPVNDGDDDNLNTKSEQELVKMLELELGTEGE